MGFAKNNSHRKFFRMRHSYNFTVIFPDTNLAGIDFSYDIRPEMHIFPARLQPVSVRVIRLIIGYQEIADCLKIFTTLNSFVLLRSFFVSLLLSAKGDTEGFSHE